MSIEIVTINRGRAPKTGPVEILVGWNITDESDGYLIAEAVAKGTECLYDSEQFRIWLSYAAYLDFIRCCPPEMTPCVIIDGKTKQLAYVGAYYHIVPFRGY